MEVQTNRGMSLLKKMGYSGGGLGRYGQGMVDPIMVEQRKRNLGLGYQHRYNKPHNYEEIKLDTTQGWMQDTLQEESRKANESARKRVEEEKAARNRNADGMSQMARITIRMDEEKEAGKLTLDTVLKVFGEFREDHAEIFSLFGLTDVACTYAVPLLVELFKGFDLVKNPSHGIVEISAWRKFIQVEKHVETSTWKKFQGERDQRLFAKLVTEGLYPAVRNWVTDRWQATDPEPLLQFLLLWKEILPSQVVDSLLDEAVVPKLLKTIKGSDQEQGSKDPVHLCTHPWLPLLRERNKLEMINCALTGNEVKKPNRDRGGQFSYEREEKRRKVCEDL